MFLPLRVETSRLRPGRRPSSPCPRATAGPSWATAGSGRSGRPSGFLFGLCSRPPPSWSGSGSSARNRTRLPRHDETVPKPSRRRHPGLRIGRACRRPWASCRESGPSPRPAGACPGGVGAGRAWGRSRPETHPGRAGVSSYWRPGRCATSPRHPSRTMTRGRGRPRSSRVRVDWNARRRCWKTRGWQMGNLACQVLPVSPLRAPGHREGQRT